MSRIFGSLLLAVLLVNGGCVREQVEASGATYRYEFWVSCFILAVGLAAIAISWFVIRRKNGIYALSIGVPAVIAIVAFVPAIFGEKVIVDHTGMTIYSGAWGKNDQRVSFEDLQHIAIDHIGELKRSEKDTVLVCDTFNGQSIRVFINNRVKIEATPEFLRRAIDLGIDVTDHQDQGFQVFAIPGMTQSDTPGPVPSSRLGEWNRKISANPGVWIVLLLLLGWLPMSCLWDTRCKACKKMMAFRRTGEVREGEGFLAKPEAEMECKYCGNREWKEKGFG